MENERETARIQQIQQQCLEFLDEVLEEIGNLGDDVYILNHEHLSALGICKAEALDIEEQCVDFGRRFFYPEFILEQPQQKTTDFLTHCARDSRAPVWRKRCRRGSFNLGLLEVTPGPWDPEERHPMCDPETHARYRFDWVCDAMGVGYTPWSGSDSTNLGVWEDSEWYFLQ